VQFPNNSHSAAPADARHERHIIKPLEEWEEIYFAAHPYYDAGSVILPSKNLLFDSCSAAVQHQLELHEIHLRGYNVLTNMPEKIDAEGVAKRFNTIVLAFHGCRTYYSMWQGDASERVVATQVSDAGGLMLVFQC
jgi:hypothetical protein